MPPQKTIILRVSERAHTALLRAAARQGLDIEEVAERALDKVFDADGRPRPDTTNEERHDRIAKLSFPVNDPATASEIDRLADVARQYQRGA